MEGNAAMFGSGCHACMQGYVKHELDMDMKTRVSENYSFVFLCRVG